jgi:hypothetical protein
MKIDTNTVFFGMKPIGDVASRLSDNPRMARIEIHSKIHSKIYSKTHSSWQPSNCTLPIHNNIPAVSEMRQCLVLPWTAVSNVSSADCSHQIKGGSSQLFGDSSHYLPRGT